MTEIAKLVFQDGQSLELPVVKGSENEKARRRYLDLKKINKKIKLKDVKKALKLRDFNDKNRKQSPLLFVRGAVLVDTTNLTKKQVKVKLIKLVKKEIRLKKKKYSLIVL